MALTRAQDLVIDPIMSGPTIRAWVWETPGSNYGVPAQNFLSWLGTAFLMVSLQRLLETWRPAPPRAQLPRSMTALPLVVYGMNVLVSMFPPSTAGLSVIGPFVLGIPSFLALGGVWYPNARQELFDESWSDRAKIPRRRCPCFHSGDEDDGFSVIGFRRVE